MLGYESALFIGCKYVRLQMYVRLQLSTARRMCVKETVLWDLHHINAVCCSSDRFVAKSERGKRQRLGQVGRV